MIDQIILQEQTDAYLKSLISGYCAELGTEFDSNTPFGDLGIDSFHILKIIKGLEADFGILPKTLLFENFNVHDLAKFFIENHEGRLVDIFSFKDEIIVRQKETIQESYLADGKKYNEGQVTTQECGPVLLLEVDAFENDELSSVMNDLRSEFKNEGTISRGTKVIAPCVFIGSNRKGYFNFNIHTNILLAYSYTGHPECFEIISSELLEYCKTNQLELNILVDEEIGKIGNVLFSSTPFGAVQRIFELQDFGLDGSKMRRLRYQVSKFENVGSCNTIEYRCGSNRDVDRSIAKIIDSWCESKTMVNPLVHIAKQEILDGTLNSEHRLFLTYIDDTLWNVILISQLSSSNNGYLMDLEFYPPNMPLGGLEYAIVKIIEVLATEGCDLLSLGATLGPKLASSTNADQVLDGVLDGLRKNRIFDDQGNLQFKNKFRPQNKSIYLCRERGKGDPNNVIDIIMMIADPSKLDNKLSLYSKNPCLVEKPEKETKVKHAAQEKSKIEVTDIQASERAKALSENYYNTLKLPNEYITHDLKTDSWAQLDIPIIDVHLQTLHSLLQHHIDFDKSIRSVFPFKHFLFTESGRSAEDLFYRAFNKKGEVPQNILFATGIFHQIDKGFSPIEIPALDIYEIDESLAYKGNINLAKLNEIITNRHGDVCLVCIEVCNNASGGCATSIDNLKEVKKLLSQYSIPLVIDGTRVLENAYKIIEKEDKYRNESVWNVVSEIFQYADVVIASLAKDFCIKKGGIVATNDNNIFAAIKDIADNDGVGLNVIDRKVIAHSLNNKPILEKRVIERMGNVRHLWQALAAQGIPVGEPCGGHCVLIDVKRIPEFCVLSNPVESFIAWLFLNGGIRVGAHNVGMQKGTALNGLVRIAIPVGFTREQTESVANTLARIFRNIKNIPDLELDSSSGNKSEILNAKYKLKEYLLPNFLLEAEEPGAVSSDIHSFTTNFKHETSNIQKNNPEDFVQNKKLFKNHESSKSQKYKQANKEDDIAVIGMAGRFPKARDINELWQNLKSGRDCIDTISEERLAWRWGGGLAKEYRGGFIEDVDKFDSLFFNISPREAQMLDPQERLFLEVAWEAIEDAGYYPETLGSEQENRDVGVFVGAVWAMYQMVGVEEKIKGSDVSPNSFLWSISNRVSYWMNFSGPSLTVDTACSSSLTALHLACESLRRKECSSAIVGGVNLDLHQSKLDINTAGGTQSPDGFCRSFGHGANGYVAGEGIAAILVKPLSQAILDRDHIYGVIKSVAVNHGGRTSGYTVPNPNAQARLIQTTLENAGIDARTIGYIEAHGTGTELGDPIEISGLDRVFKKYKVESGACSIGSIKTNIGHLEAAAGIAGICKVLLQIKNKILVPSLHSQTRNEHIDFDSSSFKVQQKTEKWERKIIDSVEFPLRCGLSSFGAGGANAHVVIEEYISKVERDYSNNIKLIFPVSAKTEAQLREACVRLVKFIRNLDTNKISWPMLEDISYTLSVGKKHFDFRLAIIAQSGEELINKLDFFLNGTESIDVITGNSRNADGIVKILSKNDKNRFVEILKEKRNISELSKLWVDGLVEDLNGYSETLSGYRTPLPTYPFVDKRHWVPIEESKNKNITSSDGNKIHPLIDANDSSFTKQVFRKTFTIKEFFIGDHRVSSIPTLPGVAYLEIARKAGELSTGMKVGKILNILWLSPLVVNPGDGTTALINLFPSETGVSFNVCSEGAEGVEKVYSQGRIQFVEEYVADADFLDIKAILARCKKTIDGNEAYEKLRSMGLDLGPGFQVLGDVYKNKEEVIGELKLPAGRVADFHEFLLHPSLIDGALQTGVAAQLGDRLDEVYVPYSIGEVEILGRLTENCYSYVTLPNEEEASKSKVSKVNVTIIDKDGKVLVRIKNSVGIPLLDVHKKEDRVVENVFENIYYEQNWASCPISLSENRQQDDSLVIFDSNDEFYKQFEENIFSNSGKNTKLVLVKPDLEYRCDKNVYTINPESKHDFIKLFEDLKIKGFSSPKIYFSWPSTSQDKGDGLNPRELEKFFVTQIYSLLFLSQALVENELTNSASLLYFYTSRFESKPFDDAVGAFLKSLVLEHPKLVCKSVGLESSFVTESKVNILQKELCNHQSNMDAILYSGADRHIQRLRYVDLKRAKTSETLTIKKNGVYLITGGLGGLGFIFAHFLSEKFAARLVLTGRSKLDDNIKLKLDMLSQAGGTATYLQSNISSYKAVKKLVSKSKEIYGSFNGVLHSAGVLRDSFIKNKELSEFGDVFSPKVYGTIYLDQILKDEQLDFFVTFSSIAAIGGNAGQADYAYANKFMDSFSANREQLRKSGNRFGKSLSINWSLWAEGGMKLDKQMELFFEKNLGIKALETGDGINALLYGLQSDLNQIVVLNANREKIESVWGVNREERNVSNKPVSIENSSKQDSFDGNLLNKVQERIVGLIIDFLKIDREDIDLDKILLDLGFDSIGLATFANAINDLYGTDITPVTFFEFPSVNAVAKHLVSDHKSFIRNTYGSGEAEAPVPAEKNTNESALPSYDTKSWSHSKAGGNFKKLFHVENSNALSAEDYIKLNRFEIFPIAVVGMSGVMPQSDDLNEFWENIIQEKNLITTVPEDRWDWREYEGDPFKEKNKSNSKWGGFMREVDKFDPLFFGISPREAESMDPQQRIFLETVWKTIEDSGYRPSDISGSKTGLFVGVATSDYTDVMNRMNIGIDGYTASGSSHAVLVNRISFLLNLKGPSIPIDTACSSSLIALHRAIESIHTGGCEMAIVGGVQVMLSPAAYISFSQAGMLSTDGRCKTFDKGANGYVRGEGVGAIFLKPLSKAESDSDHIYAVIKSTSENHGGKVTTLTAPNPAAQSELLIDAYEKANIDPSSVGYIECHGTGTSIGDPIEVQALSKAFSELHKRKGKECPANPYCGLSSVKTNIGHLETAAGIAGVLKILLSLKHKKIPASINFHELNPYINLSGTPFYIVNHSQDWIARKDSKGGTLPRVAGVSSFGFGGANAHIIFEEYESKSELNNGLYENLYLFILSAKTPERLIEYAKRHSEFLSTTKVDLLDYCYTIQIGRESMPARVSFTFKDKNELLKKLNRFIGEGKRNDEIYLSDSANKKAGSESGSSVVDVSNLVLRNMLEQIAIEWVNGCVVDWNKLYTGVKPKRISVPTYPFLKQRYWFKNDDSLLNVEHGKELQNNRKPEISAYKPVWRESVLDQPAHNSEIKSANILIFDIAEDMGNAIRNNKIPNYPKIGNVILVKPSSSYIRLSKYEYQINSGFDADYFRLLEEISNENLTIDHVIFSCGSDSNNSFFSSDSKIFNRNLYLVFNLLKAFRKIRDIHAHSEKIKFLYLYDSVEMAGVSSMAMGAFFKSVALEDSGFSFKTIGIVGQRVEANDKIRMAWQELFSTYSGAANILYENGKRLSKKMELREIPKKHNALFKHGGIYIISGGLGGIGFSISEFLVKTYKARLVILGRAKLDESVQVKIDKLNSYGGAVNYVCCDISNYSLVDKCVNDYRSRFNRIDGVINCSGTLEDSLYSEKNWDDIESVISSKTLGTANLDEATKNDDIDFFLLFSSIAAVAGNIGQSDYSYANSFMDHFCSWREILRADGKRSGKSLSINWPLWDGVGMQADPATIHGFRDLFGIYPLRIESGIEVIQRGLASDFTNFMVLEANADKSIHFLNRLNNVDSLSKNNNSRSNINNGSPALDAELVKNDTFNSNAKEIFKSDLLSIILDVLKLDRRIFNENSKLSEYGLDSIGVTQLFREISQLFSIEIAPSIFYDYPTFSNLYDYFIREHAESLTKKYVGQAAADIQENFLGVDSFPRRSTSELQKNSHQSSSLKRPADNLVAVIGMAGVMPKSKNLDEFWRNLIEGNDLVEEVPFSRWDWRSFYGDPKREKNKTYAKWGSFVSDVDQFDAEFFGIPFEEAVLMDPQQRIFMEVVWNTIEDAGYNASDLAGSKLGLFVGVGSSDYLNVIKESESEIYAYSSTGNAHSILANRISYFFGFTGPSEPVDTACSSSLVSIHRAAESIAIGSCEAAIAGGVNLLLSPALNISLSMTGVLSADGRCKSFDKDANGYVRGEGAGAIFLKPLEKAIRDKDHIRGIIRATGVNHGGKASALTAPNPAAQTALIRDIYNKSGIDPSSLTYIEAHGTGTLLGDSLEISSLKKAFSEVRQENNWSENSTLKCGIGTVKSNIGHLETAAGIASVFKVLGALQHGILPGNLHFNNPSPLINLKDSPFYIVNKPQKWKRFYDNQGMLLPRRAGISSFGFGGSNAHIVIEEYIEDNNESLTVAQQGVFIVPLSAQTNKQLKTRAEDLLRLMENLDVDDGHNTFVNRHIYNIANVAYTLQVGRTHMRERLGFTVTDTKDLMEKIKSYLNGNIDSEGVYEGNVGSDREAVNVLNEDIELNQIVVKSLIQRKDFAKLLELWVSGFSVQWDVLHMDKLYTRVSLPTYSFSGKRYWVREKSSSGHGALNKNDSVGLVKQEELSDADMLSIESYLNMDQEINSVKVVRDDNDAARIVIYLEMMDVFETRISEASNEDVIERIRKKLIDKYFEYKNTFEIITVDKFECGDSPRESISNGVNSKIRVKYTKPKNKTEKIVSEVWREIFTELKNPICMHDNFFDIGGSSVSAVKMMQEINEKFSIEIELKDIFDHKSISSLSNFIESLKKSNKFSKIDMNEEHAEF